MSGLIILILIFVGLPLLWRAIKPWFFRWSQRRMEDALRNAMGMPPRDESRSSSHAGGSRRSYYSSSGRAGEGRRQKSRHESGPLIPKEYAVDVEYNEIHSYSQETEIASDGRRVSYQVESQVSEAEIIEIRKDR